MDLFERAVFSDISPKVVDQFLTFHKENPEIYALFKRFAFEARAAGRKRFGAAAICERIRWHVAVERKNDDFKVNNNFRSCLARLMIFDHPEFADFFETRRTPGTVSEAA